MSNREKVFLLQDINARQKLFLGPLFYLLCFMSLNRFLLYRNMPSELIESSWTELLFMFWTGGRFDLLVLGFICIPMVLTSYLPLIVSLPAAFVQKIHQGWLFILWTLLVIIELFAHPFFLMNSRHPTGQQILDKGLAYLNFYTSTTGLFVFVILALQIGVGYSVIYQMPNKITSKSPSLPKLAASVLRIIIPIFLVAFAARGTITPHHLEKSHSLISKNKVLNELALNAAWNFDK